MSWVLCVNLESCCISRSRMRGLGQLGIGSSRSKMKNEVYLSGNDDTSTEKHLRQRSVSNEVMPSESTVELVFENTVALKRKVGLLSGISFIVGTMIGSGIFISPKGVLENTGSVGTSLCVWAGCGLVALLGSLCFAELGTFVTTSGGPYAYLLEAFGPIPAFLFIWVKVFITTPSSLAIISLTFSEYALTTFFDNCGPSTLITKLLTSVVILTIVIINSYSVKMAAKVQVFCAFAKVAALAMIIVGGIIMLTQGHTEHLATGFEGTTPNPSLIALAFYRGLWAYDGWSNLNYVTEEIKNPVKNLPLAIMIGIPLVTVLYLMTNISYFTVMSAPELLASNAVGVTWGVRVLGGAAFVIPIAVALSTFGAANGTTFAGGRVLFVSAREGHMMKVLSMVHAKRLTPMPSLVFMGIMAIIMIIPGDIFTLIDFFSFTSWLFYGATMLALIVMRFTKKDVSRPYKVPIIIPIIILLASAYLVVAPIIQNPAIEFLYAFLFIIGGLLVYVPFVHFKMSLPLLDYVTMFCQLLFEVTPTD